MRRSTSRTGAASRVKHFTVSPLDVTLRGASTDLAKPIAITVGAVIDDVAPFKAEGTVTPEPLAADLGILLSGARMQILQPYVLPVADLTIQDGKLTVEGKVRLDPPEAPGPDLRFDGDVTIDGFASIDNTLKKDFVNFRRLEIRKVSYAMGPDSVSVDQVLVQQPFARVIISPERVINVSAVMDPKGTAAALEARRAAAAADASLTPAQRKKRDRQREAAEEQAAKDRKAAGTKAPPALAPLPKETMPVRIRQVRIEQGTMDFADNSVQPNFAARVEHLAGTMTGLSSDPASHAKLDFKGRVGEFSPVTITGEVQPFSFERYADIGLKFENISLPIFNPYSGRFAGYSIAKGKLTTDLHYLITDRKLDAKHHIVIDQLEWGEATGGKDEATLPVKFATVLLRDRNGVIDLNIPVTGTLDDPQFRIGPIIWQVIKNLIVKAVTAPFALLGALFSGAEEAQHVDFAAGSSVLDPATIGNLGSLAKSMVDKPGLKLDVPIGALPELDGPALLALAYDAALADAMNTALPAPRKEGGSRPPFESLSAQNKLTVLTAIVKKQTGTEPAIPEPAAPPEGTSREDAKAMEQAAAIDYLEQQARSQRFGCGVGIRATRRGTCRRRAARPARRQRTRARARVPGAERKSDAPRRQGPVRPGTQVATAFKWLPGRLQAAARCSPGRPGTLFQPGDPTSQCANASHGPVPETARLRGCDTMVARPAHSVTGCNRRRVERSQIASARMNRSESPK